MVPSGYMFLALSFVVSSSLESGNFNFLPGLNSKFYTQLGDINIGAMVNVMKKSPTRPAEICSNEVRLSYAVESTEAVAFAVHLINRNPDILPNISLGYVIGGTCESSGVNIGTSLTFLPRSQRDLNSSSCSVQATGSPDSWTNHDVIGVVGVGWSKLSVPVSSLYAVGRLPIVGTLETSDEFSNKRYHPYFFRIVPPDMYQIQAILKFIAANGWSYISIVYEDGSYGQKAYDRMQLNAGKYGICVATSHRLIHPPQYDKVVADLLLNNRARVVVVFIEPSSFRDLLQAVNDKNATGHFIWVGADSLLSYVGYEYKGANYDLAIGTFTFDIHVSHVPEFNEYLKRQRFSDTKNPWMRQIWDYLYDCHKGDDSCELKSDALQGMNQRAFTKTTLRIDAALTLAQAAHDLLSTKCPNSRGDEARACISGELLRDYLKNTSFEGFNGRVKFDENQDVKGKYLISQIAQNNIKNPDTPDTNVFSKRSIVRKKIAIYDISKDIFTYFNETVSWTYLSPLEGFVPWTEKVVTIVPQSKCSIPCRVGEYKIERELPCCWECRKCRENEHLVNDNTTCETCPSFMWPDPASEFTTCIAIPLTYPMFNDPIPIVFTSLAIFTLVITVYVMVSFSKYGNERVIKASSRELSVIQLFAIFTGYATVILFQIKPSDKMCGVIFFLFCMSFVLLYSPLFVKTVRICRIFKSGSKNEKPRFISPQSQLVFANLLIVVQVTLCTTVYILYWPRAKRTQPIWSEKLVELSCDLTFPGIASFLGYNIVLVSLCSVFAFMVRKLPDNFNESKFISMCVSTTLLIWLAFIPAYFTADREFVRVFLLSMALFLNHSVALLFLFMPKIYAIKFLPSEAGEFSKNRS